MKQPGFLKETIAVTMGDPNGIGPEVAVKAIAAEEVLRAADILLIGSTELFGEAIERFVPILRPTIVADAADAAGKGIAILDTGGSARRNGEPPGPTREGGAASLDAIRAAVAAAIAGQVDAIVTAPISKEAMALAGCPHPGHTELLARETDTRRPVMMMVGGGLRVALVTIHVAVRKLPLHLDEDAVWATIRTTAEGLTERFGIASPRIAVCGLNPHAGEGGLFGREEKEVIRPAIERATDKGLDVEGPLPADSAFHRALSGRYDAVVAMYHDQGLIPVKLLAFHGGVNVTLGLPIIRTSPDHGTAFDIAGRGIADPGSMRAAVMLAMEMARPKA